MIDIAFRPSTPGAGAVRGHRDMVLLVRGGGDRIDAGRIGAGLVLGDKRGSGHLRDHEAGIEPRLRGQKRGQPGKRRIDQKRDPALGQRADLANRERYHVGGEGDWFGVKITTRQRFVRFREDQRIVGDPVGLVASVAAAWRNRSRHAPITCGWQRRQ